MLGPDQDKGAKRAEKGMDMGVDRAEESGDCEPLVEGMEELVAVSDA